MCLQLEPFRPLPDSLSHYYGTREAAVLCRVVPIGKHVRKTVPSRIDWAQEENNSLWEALKECFTVQNRARVSVLL